MNQDNPFSSLGLADPIVRAVADAGYTEPTPVQKLAIPALMAGRDVLAAAQTGTGKTAAFSLPLIERIAESASERKPKKVLALILAPTRELAAQIYENIALYSKYLDTRCALVFGGVKIKPQTEALAQGIDVLVATPGRLLDHISQKNLSLSSVKYFVLDEADRMLDMGFIHDIRQIMALLPEKRQNLLFSATFSPEIRRLADSFLKDPFTVEIQPNREPALIEQSALCVAKRKKHDLLRDLIVDRKWEQVLVFTRMKYGANRLCQQLIRDGITAAAIHGNKSQAARTKALAQFKEKGVRVLVATDIAARGLDIEELPVVVNYDLPNVPEDYVHRIGRTGRAGLAGEAVSLVTPEDMPLLEAVEKLIGKSIPRSTPEGYEVTEEEAAEKPAEKPSRRKPRRGGQKAADAPQEGAAETKDEAQGRGKPSSRPRKPKREKEDPDNFGNSIHYRSPRAKKGASRAKSDAIPRYEPIDPFAPEHQALFLPQTMPGEEPRERKGKGGRTDRVAQDQRRHGPKKPRSTDYFERNSRYSDSMTHSNLPPGLAPRRGRSRGR